MSSPPDAMERLRFLLETVRLEAALLSGTDFRLFSEAMTVQRAASLATDELLAERVDAYVARFARLQDTLGDKLLPALLSLLGEPLGAVIDNLNRAERLGWLSSAAMWLALRPLRNEMIHGYVRDASRLAAALTFAHEHLPVLENFASALTADASRRFPSDA